MLDAKGWRSRAIGRSRSRVLVEEAAAITARDLLRRPEVRAHLAGAAVSFTLSSGETFAFPLTSLTAVREQRIPWPPGLAQRWLLRCPRCGACRRALYLAHDGLACRLCLELRYQSWSERWDFPLIERMSARRELLRRRPGPKGRRFCTWARRVARVEATARAWLDGWESKYGEALAEL